MNALTQIDAEIQKRRDELQALESARKVLDGGSKASVKVTRRRPSGGRTRPPAGQRKEQVLATLNDEPQGPSAIGRAVGIGPSQVSAILRDLKKEGAAKKRGDGWVKVITSAG